jgi:hypothetical protein
MLLQIRKEIVDGKKRIIIINSVSGQDKVRDAVNYVMGIRTTYNNEKINQKEINEA